MSTLSFPAAVRLVAEREVSTRVRDKAFLISTAFLLVIAAATVAVPLLVERLGGRDTYTVAAVGQPALETARAAASLGDAAARADDATSGVPQADLAVTEVADDAAARDAVRDGTADVALVPDDGAAGLALVGESSVPSEVAELVARGLAAQRLDAALAGSDVDRGAVDSALEAVPAQQLLDTDADQRGIALVVGLVFTLLFFFTVFSYGMQIAQSVTEEKQSRIVELLVTAVPVRALLVGKILGNATLALGQVVLLLAVSLAGASVGGQSGLVSVLLRSSGWFVLFFVLGFVMLACLWAAAGALATRQEDLQSTTLPLQILVMGPFFVSVYVTEPGRWLSVLSFVPFSSPIVMPRRIALGDAAWWEVAVSAGLVVVTAAVVVAIGTRLYENSLLQTRSKVAWSRAWSRVD